MTLGRNGERVWAVAFSPDGQTLASGTDDKAIRLWDVASGQELQSLGGNGGSVNGIAFSPDGRILASGSADETIRLWDVTSSQELRTLEGHRGEVNSVAFSPDGEGWHPGLRGERSFGTWRAARNG
jgi:WD40 repeat protein